MKTGHYTGSALATCLSFGFLLGCSQEKAVSQSTASNPVTAEVVAPVLPVAPPVPVAGPASVTTTATTNAAAATTPAVVPENLSPGVAEIARLAQANVGETVLIAYSEKLEAPGDPTADEILYLTDIGVSEPVITALLKRAKEQQVPAAPAPAETVAPAAALAAAPAPVAPAVETVAVPAPAVAETAPVLQTQYVAAPAQPAVTVNYFYENLAPYGNWVEVEDYGRCWQPTVVVSDPHWQPYCDRGRWVYTDCGWYWHSDYSWGWAAFHYGRWTRSPRHGWVWCPDTTWGPSWVSWRNNDDYCGWAPLPPAARYRPGVGFSYHDRNVGVSFEFGLTQDCYTFVPTRQFCDPTPYRHRLSSHEAGRIYGRTTVNNNYTVNNINQNIIIVNQGVAPGKVAAVTGRPVPQAQVKPGKGGGYGGDVYDRKGHTVYVNQPAPKPDQQVTPVIRTHPGQPATVIRMKDGKAPDQVAAPVRVSPTDPNKSPFVKVPASGPREPGEKTGPAKAFPGDTGRSPVVKTPSRREPTEEASPVRVLPADTRKPSFVKTPGGQKEPERKPEPAAGFPGTAPAVRKPSAPFTAADESPRPRTFPGESRPATPPTEAWVKPKTGTPTPTRSPQAQPIFKQPIVVNRPAPVFAKTEPDPAKSGFQAVAPVSPREGVTIRGPGLSSDRQPSPRQPEAAISSPAVSPEPAPVRKAEPVSPVFTPTPVAPFGNGGGYSQPAPAAPRHSETPKAAPGFRSGSGSHEGRETARPQGGGFQNALPAVKAPAYSAPTPKSSPSPSPSPKTSGPSQSDRSNQTGSPKDRKP